MVFSIPENLHPELMPLAWLIGTWRGRGGQGIINIISSERNGGVASTFTINHEDQITRIAPRLACCERQAGNEGR